MTPVQKQDYTLRITQANKTQMITILYEMTIDFLEDAAAALEAQDHDGMEREIAHADACIDELIASLNLNYELAGNLLGLYLFEKRELLHARTHRELMGIRHAIKLFSAFRDAYRQLEEQDTDGPLMTNVPKVYAGMTYGRGELEESISGDYANRGFRA